MEKLSDFSILLLLLATFGLPWFIEKAQRWYRRRKNRPPFSPTEQNLTDL